mgnify:CR=1 FL=1
MLILDTKINGGFIHNYGKIEIEESEIEGNIDTRGIGEIEVIGSKVGGEVESRGISEVLIEGSELGVGRIRVEEGSGIKIGNSEVEVEKEINISGRMEIEKSEIKSE